MAALGARVGGGNSGSNRANSWASHSRASANSGAVSPAWGAGRVNHFTGSAHNALSPDCALACKVML